MATFVGRQSDHREVASLLDEHRVVTLVGPGGMGKTRLALELAGNQVGAFPHGVYFVRLAPLGAAEHIVATVARAIGFQFQADERSPKQQLLDYVCLLYTSDAADDTSEV